MCGVLDLHRFYAIRVRIQLKISMRIRMHVINELGWGENRKIFFGIVILKIIKTPWMQDGDEIFRRQNYAKFCFAKFTYERLFLAKFRHFFAVHF